VKEQTSIEGWKIIATNGLYLFGKPSWTARPEENGEHQLYLSPVYQLHVGLQQRELRPGVIQKQWIMQILPVLGLASLKGIEVGRDCAWISVEDLNEFDRKSLRDQLANGEEDRRSMLASQRTGLDLLGSMRG
jgi:hypothetical protein